MDFRNIKICGILILSLCVVACKKFVEVKPPTGKIVSETVFSNPRSATSALMGIYNQMQSESYAMSRNCGLLSDELVNNSNNIGLIGFYTNHMNAVNTPASQWNNAYKYIYQANAIIEGLNSNPEFNASIKQQLIGEAEFIRAYWYFYLTNLYGAVPLVLSTDYKTTSGLPQTETSAVYDQIINDLLNAEQLLNTDYINETDTAITTERIRPTKWAAKALLARCYLFINDFQKASLKSNEVIDHVSQFALEPDLKNVFLANSVETIWQLAFPTPNTFYTQDGVQFILIAAPKRSGTSNTSTISADLLQAFEPGDQRRTVWVDSFTTTIPPINNFYYPFKYQVLDLNHNPDSRVEYTMMLRLAEQYLIRAEARLHLNEDISLVVSDLNTIRRRAGLVDYSGSLDPQNLSEAILKERRFEFFAEWGHRWFDLSRTGAIDSVMNTNSPSKGGVWVSDGRLFPIPQSEIDKDANLRQNHGY